MDLGNPLFLLAVQQELKRQLEFRLRGRGWSIPGSALYFGLQPRQNLHSLARALDGQS